MPENTCETLSMDEIRSLGKVFERHAYRDTTCGGRNVGDFLPLANNANNLSAPIRVVNMHLRVISCLAQPLRTAYSLAVGRQTNELASLQPLLPCVTSMPSKLPSSQDGFGLVFFLSFVLFSLTVVVACSAQVLHCS